MKHAHCMVGPFWFGYVVSETAAMLGMSVWPLHWQLQIGFSHLLPYINLRRVKGDQ